MAKKQTPSFSADDFINNIAANASNIAATEAARNRETPTADPIRVGETSPASPTMSPASPKEEQPTPAAGSVPSGLPAREPQPDTPATSESRPASPIYPDCVARALAEKPKTLIAFTPTAIDIKLATLSSQQRISKKRIVLEALLDYLHKRDLLTDEERDQWLQLPKEFGTPGK